MTPKDEAEAKAREIYLGGGIQAWTLKKIATALLEARRQGRRDMDKWCEHTVECRGRALERMSTNTATYDCTCGLDEMKKG